MKINFHTNLDEAQNDVFQLGYKARIPFDTTTHPVPRKGERLTFPFDKWEVDRSRRCEYELEVVGVRYDYANDVVCIELHIPATHGTGTHTLGDWITWFRKFRLGKDY